MQQEQLRRRERALSSALQAPVPAQLCVQGLAAGGAKGRGCSPSLALGVGWAGTKGCHIPTEGTDGPEARARD